MKPLRPQNIIISQIKRLFGKPSEDYRMTIGEVLKQRGIISEKQLQHALAVQKEKLTKLGKAVRLGQIIVELGYATEKELVQAIKIDYKIEVNSLTDDIKGLVKEKRGTFVEGLPPPRVPIWLQLFAATLIIILTTITVLGVLSLREQRERLYQQTVKIGKVSLNYFGSNAPIPLLDDNILRLNTLIHEATDVEGLKYATIVDHNNFIKAHTDLDQIGQPFTGFAGSHDIRKEKEVTYFDYTDLSGEHVLNLSRPIVFQGKTLGEVHVGVSIDFIQDLVRRERESIIIIGLFIIAFGVIIAIYLGVRFSQPISDLVLATQEIGSGNYTHKIVLARNDELGNLATAFNRMGEELRKNLLMQKSFGKYVGSEVLDMIMADPESAWLKGHRNEATIVFVDIRGFTAYSEVKEPEQIVDVLNEYFELATQAIRNHGGYIDKFIGDAVLGVFGVPVFHENHAERAVHAAQEMISLFEKERPGKSDLFKAVGIGINTGVVVSGNIGSQDKMEYTVIGDTVNVASRLNGLAGPGEIVVSNSVHAAVKSLFRFETLPPQRIKGRSEPITVYKVVNGTHAFG